jgi:hypothetical protein
MQLVLNSEMGSKTEAEIRAADVVQVICNTKMKHNFNFNLNLENKVVHGNINNFGVFTVMVRAHCISKTNILEYLNICFIS